ncbi:MAG TPA: hypothetical protein VLB09_09070, partial [Nitrospiria bacterium]|nr:hypothetical protein [Nitrospiria bacterium]
MSPFFFVSILGRGKTGIRAGMGAGSLKDPDAGRGKAYLKKTPLPRLLFHYSRHGSELVYF